jgi:hypothetical protein
MVAVPLGKGTIVRELRHDRYEVAFQPGPMLTLDFAF